MNNDSIKQGAYYLLRGGTLLSEPCKKCGNLQIKYKGEILCMNCQTSNGNRNSSVNHSDKEHGDRESSKLIGKSDENGGQSTTLDNDSKTKIEENLVLEVIEDKLTNSISDLAVNLTAGGYSKEYRNTLKSIKKSLEILEMIRRIKRLSH